MTFSFRFFAVLCGLFLLPAMIHAAPSTQPTKLLTTFEKSQFKASAHPSNVMDFYKKLAKQTPWVRIETIGKGDSGRPIHLVMLSKKKTFEPGKLTTQTVVMTINGIHSGESCGIDATQMLMRDLVQKMKSSDAYDNVVLVTIPIYNVGGHSHFHPYNRVNQNGPTEMGFRGNGRNYDLNRDFMKADSLNVQALYRAFHRWKPHVFIDNHTTNGADYQHVMTYYMTSPYALTPPLRTFTHKLFKPAFEKAMEKRKFPLIPYVILKKHGDIKKGLVRGVSSPRYSTGFTRLFHTISILSEAHMLKPYKDRVLGTYALNDEVLLLASKHAVALRKAQQRSEQFSRSVGGYVLRWKLTKKATTIRFLGYKYKQRYSPVSGASHVWYDRTKPVTWQLPYYNICRPTLRVKSPKAYIIPQSWRRVIKRLQWNGIQMTQLKKAKELQVEQYMFTQVKWPKRPYEGHHRPQGLKVHKVTRKVRYKAGDYLVSMNQRGAMYLLEALEPMARDSFVSWNFFDTVFQQKEFFSPYLFAPLAAAILKKNPQLRRIFHNRLRKEPNFAKNPYQRLHFIYQSSRYYEASHNVYPIGRVMN